MDRTESEIFKVPERDFHWHADLLLHEPANKSPLQDASAMVSGIARGVVNEVEGFIDFLSKPNAVNDSLLALASQLGRAGGSVAVPESAHAISLSPQTKKPSALDVSRAVVVNQTGVGAHVESSTEDEDLHSVF